MSCNEETPCRELIDPTLGEPRWDWDRRIVIGGRRVDRRNRDQFAKVSAEATA